MISEEIGRIGLIPIAVFEREKDILPTAKALLQADIPVIEITFRTSLAEPAIKKVKQAFPEMLVGAGTILTKEQAYTAVKAGADFIVTPGLKEEVVKVCQEEETLIIPGCVTPVSYTHLDVYKRQVNTRGLSGSAICWKESISPSIVPTLISLRPAFIIDSTAPDTN